MKLFTFVKKVFFLGLAILSNFTNALDYMSMKNQECKIRPKVINIDSNNPIFYPFSIKINKCSGSCNKICVPDVIKDLNVKVFKLMSRINETKFIKWHEKCKCECRLNAIICNNKQSWKKNKCRSECRELIDKGICDKGFIWSPSNCDCECDKNCDFSEYLDYKNCKCRKKLVDKTIEEVKLTEITLFKNENNYKYSYCKVYIVFMIVVFTTFIGITIYFLYYNWSLLKIIFLALNLILAKKQKFGECNI